VSDRIEAIRQWVGAFEGEENSILVRRCDLRRLLAAADEADRLRALLLRARDGWPMLARELTREIDASITGGES